MYNVELCANCFYNNLPSPSSLSLSLLFQITAFVSVMGLDGMRQARYRFDVLCCFKIDKSSLPDVREKPSLLFLFMKKIWTRYIVLHPLARPFWVSYGCMVILCRCILVFYGIRNIYNVWMFDECMVIGYGC